MPLGEITLDGQPLELAKGPNGQGWAYLLHAQATLPGQKDPDEARVARAPAEVRRTLPWLDWSGGLGAAKVDSRSFFGGHANNRLHYSEGPTGRNPNRLVRGHQKRTVTVGSAAGSVTDFFEFGSALYAVIGDSVRLVTITLNAETLATRIATTGVANGTANGVYLSGYRFTTASPPWYDGTNTKVFLGTSSGATHYIVAFDGTSTWTQSTATVTGYWALSQATDGQRLWASSSSADTTGPFVGNVGTTSNPATGGIGTSPWSAKFPIGNRAIAITGLAALRDGVIVTTGDGMIYRVDYATGLPVPLVDQDGQIISTTTGLQMGVWNGMLVVPTPRGLMLYEESGLGPGTFVAIGPESLHGNEMPSVGQCTALYKGDPEYLWAAFYDGTDSWVWGIRRPYPGEQVSSRMVADTMGVGRIAAKQVTALHISHLGTNPILVCGSNTPDLTFVTLPRQGLNVVGPNADANCRSATSVEKCYLPDNDGGAPTTSKPFRRIRFKSINMTTTEYVNVSVRVDRGNFAQVGTIDDSPTKVINLPTGTEGTAIGVELDWYGTANTSFPQIEAVEVDMTERPQTSKWADVGVYVAANQQTASGQSASDPVEIHAFLERLADQVRYVDFIDPQDRPLSVSVDPFQGVHMTYAEQLPDKQPGYVINFRLLILDELLSNPAARWDVDAYSGGTKVSYYG